MGAACARQCADFGTSHRDGGQRETTQFQSIPVRVQANALHPGGVIGLARSYGDLDVRLTRRTTMAGRPLEIVGGLAYDTMREQRRGWQNFQGTVLDVQDALRRADSRSTFQNAMYRPVTDFEQSRRTGSFFTWVVEQRPSVKF